MANELKSVVRPNLETVLDDVKDAVKNEINCHSIGVIDSFDAPNQTATVKLVFKKKIDNVIREYPLLVDCPVMVMSGGNGSVRFPISVGDTCLVLFSDNNIDTWYDTGQIAAVPSIRKHSISDAIALVGLRNLRNVITDYDPNATELVKGATKVTLKDKIALSNSSSDFKTLIDALIDAIINLVTIGSPASQVLNPATVAILEGIKTDFDGVFE